MLCMDFMISIFQVLIIGGGDGGMAREVLKFPSVESITVCEIDKVQNCTTIFSYKHVLRCGFQNEEGDILKIFSW